MGRPGITFDVLRPSPGPLVRADRGAIAGLFERGPSGRAVLIASRRELDRVFGGLVDGMLGPRAARAFFENGGTELVVSRVLPPSASAATGALELVNGTSLSLAAADSGAFGNRLRVEAKLRVSRRVTGVAASPTRIDSAGASAADVGRPVLVADGTAQAWAVIIDATAGDGYTISPALPGLGPNLLATVFESTFALRVTEPERAAVEIEGLSLATAEARAELAQRLAGTPITALDPLPPPSALSLPVPGASVGLAGGSDGLETGSSSELAAAFVAAFDALDASPLPDIVFCPDLWSRVYATKGIDRLALDDADARSLSIELVRRAARRLDRVVLLDPPLDPDTLESLGPTELEAWKAELAAALLDDRDFAALYAPWVRTLAPELRYRGDETFLEPPSGYVAGRIARTAATRGAWISTGNVELAGVLGTSRRLDEPEIEALAAIGVNPLVTGPTGVSIDGVRSLSFPDRPAWRFLSTRRLFNYLRRALVPLGLSYVFEPNDPATWAQLRRDLENLLRDLFSQGAFAGSTPSDAYFVRVDASLNPEEARENGVLTAQIGVAPSAPLEFLVVRLVARRDGPAVTMEAA